MRICHLTPHLPPDQAANALLPVHLGTWAREAGDEPSYVSYASPDRKDAGLPGPVVWIPPRSRRRSLRLTRAETLVAATRIARMAATAVERADLVHIHSNGLLTEVGSVIAARRRKPVVLTLYGTEIWHYQPRRIGPDLFTRAFRRAAAVTLYSHGLLHRAQQLGLHRREMTVIYPPVSEEFQRADFAQQAEARRQAGLRQRHVIVNVKRLHPLAGQRYLIEAMNEVIRTHPDVRLVICGTGPFEGELKKVARGAGVEAHVKFAGLVENRNVARYCMAADVFVLPSLLEACPTVALEALACGTPVISSDNPGGVELNDLFGADVTIVPRENSLALGHAIVEFLENKRRTRAGTSEIIRREMHPALVAARFRDVYCRALEKAA